MSLALPLRIIESASADARLGAALDFLRRFPPTQPLTIVGASRGAADDLARRFAVERPATIGLSRFSLTQLAATLAVTRLAGHGIAPATRLGTEAAVTRATFEAAHAGALSRFGRVAATPGFPRALAHTLTEIRLAGIPGDRLAEAGSGGRDLQALLARTIDELEASRAADRAVLLRAATEAVADAPESRHQPLLLLDVPVESEADAEFITALIRASSDACATVPRHDERTRLVLTRVDSHIVDGGAPSSSGRVPTDLEQLREHLFADAPPPERAPDGALQLFSAPGEGRECVEIVRRVLAEARRGVRFDAMAILVRTPAQYHGLLEHALTRGGVPAWFDRGLKRPHPAGRAFLALLSCAAEGLSAARFAEYLSLGQLPPPGDSGREVWAASTDEVLAGAGAQPPDEDEDLLEPLPSDDEERRAAVAGTLRTPRRWERMLVEASVVGGGPDRWRRRLDGLRGEMELRLVEARREDPNSAKAAAIERDIERLGHLCTFALPLIDGMGEWPERASWSDWLERLERLAPRVLRTPGHVLRVLADLRPMGVVGPVTIAEVRAVLADRLLLVDAEPPARRYGRVFVATPDQARGRAFRVVFLPGLAERMFPQKLRQDPLLPDQARERVDPGLATRLELRGRERLLLHLAVGAATECLYVSYPRLDVAEGRARVPSFYALDVVRGVTGRIPDHETLTAAAAQAGDTSLAWPAPADPAAAIDDQEHDLAVLRTLLDAPDPSAVRGHAQYLLKLNPALRRSVRERWARGERRWSALDGMTQVTDGIRAPLAGYRLSARPYSLSALQRFSACPYQFVLGAMYRLAPAEHPQALQRLDPLTKGSLFHRMQTVFFRRLESEGALPLEPAGVDHALDVLAEVIDTVEREFRERLVPAIARVWRDEMAAIARDLRGWVRQIAEEGHEWLPTYFELAFGLRGTGDERDPHSAPDPVLVDGRFVLRGSVDLVETNRRDGSLRITDHKTGKNRTPQGMVINGGAVLQPVLYSLAVEAITGQTAVESRLSFCTTAGGFSHRVIPLTPVARHAGIEALEIVDRAIELGMLAAAPAEGACQWCDFRPVCGPNEEQRVARKPVDPLRDLAELRSRP